MKLITKFQSFSDIVTNSSSEVFVVKADIVKELSKIGLESGYITIQSIDYEWIDNYYMSEWECICAAADIDRNLFGERNQDWWYWELTKVEEWDKYVKEHLFDIADKLQGYVFLEIEDHYDTDDWEDDRDIARDNAIYYESRH